MLSQRFFLLRHSGDVALADEGLPAASSEDGRRVAATRLLDHARAGRLAAGGSAELVAEDGSVVARFELSAAPGGHEIVETLVGR